MRRLVQRLREGPEQGLYVLVGVAAVVLLFIVGFIVENSTRVHVHFVLFTKSTSLIWVILVSLFLGIVIGAALALFGPLARLARQERLDRPREPR